MARGRRAVGRTKKVKESQTKISPWLGHGSRAESTPPPEGDERNLRKNLRWLHAGVYEDIRSRPFDIWYTFKQRKNKGYKIDYARDGEGVSLGNYSVGQIKRNLITFDDHHLRKWRHFMSRRGTWLYGNATRGRSFQRKVLLDTFLDLGFIDPFPDGRRNKAIGPALNVIHNDDDKTGPGAARSSSSRRNTSSPPVTGECYPNTNIPLITAGIKIGAFKKIDEDAMKVIGNFLTGRLSYYTPNSGQRIAQVDRIESGFYDQGWRVDRAAVDQALEDMHEPGRNAFNSAAFIRNLPIRVDMYKGEGVENLMEKVGGKATTDRSNSDDESDDESDNDSDTSSENALFVGQSKKRSRTKPSCVEKKAHNRDINLAKVKGAGRKLQAAHNSASEDFDFLPDDSPLKGKGRALRKHSSDQSTESQDIDHIEIDEETSVPAKRIKSEGPVFQNTQDNPIIIDEDSMDASDSDIEIDEERSCPKGGIKREISDNIIVLDIGDE